MVNPLRQHSVVATVRDAKPQTTHTCKRIGAIAKGVFEIGFGIGCLVLAWDDLRSKGVPKESKFNAERNRRYYDFLKGCYLALGGAAFIGQGIFDLTPRRYKHLLPDWLTFY